MSFIVNEDSYYRRTNVRVSVVEEEQEASWPELRICVAVRMPKATEASEVFLAKKLAELMTSIDIEALRKEDGE